MLGLEAQKFLDRLKRRKSKEMWEQTPDEARAYVATQAKLSHKKPQDHIKVTDIILTHHPKELANQEVHTLLRFYRPHSENGAPPLILYFHGGGFVTGNCDYVDSLCQKIAETTGALVISVEYHLAPEHPFPFPVYEGLSILRTLLLHTEAYRFDPEKITLMGDSAGANLAAVITNLASKDIALQAQVLLYPVTDFYNDYPSHKEFAKNYFLTKENMDWARKHYLQDLKKAKDPLASPIFAEHYHKVPKTLIITAEHDPLRDEGRAYAERLISFGKEVHYHEYPGVIHCFVTFIDFFPNGGGAALQEVKLFLSAQG